MFGHSGVLKYDANSEVGAANYQQSAISPNRWFYGVSSFTANRGTPVVGSIDPNGRHPGWLLDASSDEVISSEILLPPGVTKFKISLVVANAGSGSGDVAFNYNLDYFNIDGNLDVPPIQSATSDIVITVGSRSIKKVVEFPVTNAPASSGLEIFFRLKRIGTSVSDTLSNDVAIVGLIVEQAE